MNLAWRYFGEKSDNSGIIPIFFKDTWNHTQL